MKCLNVNCDKFNQFKQSGCDLYNKKVVHLCENAEFEEVDDIQNDYETNFEVDE